VAAVAAAGEDETVTSPGGTLTERLQLVVDATTNQAEARFSKLTGVARETGETATRSANSVRDAADRVAAARDREATAAGNLRVAETRLDALRQSGRARADQLAAAEEKVAGAQRGLQLATRNTQRATEDQARAQRDATTEMERGQQSGGRLQGVLGRVTAEAAALGGVGLGVLLRGLGEGFATGARDAGQLATSMNTTVESAGAFLGLVGSLGLELNDLLEIQAEFAQKVTDNGQALQDLGVEVDRNANGTVNWADTLVNFLDRLQGVEDATERNRLGFQFLGEEGFKQMSRLVNSGTSVRDALEKIGVPFTQEDIDAAAEYDAAMLDLSLTSTRTQQALGRALLPVLTAIAEGIGDVTDAVEDIPLPLGLATVAAIAMGITGFNPAAAAGGRLTAVMAAASRQLEVYNGVAAMTGRVSATMGVALGGAAAGVRGLVGLAGGPLGVALIALGGLWSAASGGADAFRESARKAAQQLAETGEAADDTRASIEEMARRLAQDAGFWESYAAGIRGTQEVFEDTPGEDPLGILALQGAMGDGEVAALGYEAQIREAGDALGAFGSQQATAEIATKALNDLIAEGTTSGQKFADAIRDAAEAEAAQARTSDLAEAAIAAYNATTRDAVQTTLDLFNAQLQQSGGLIGLQQAVHEARDVVDDLSTPWDEVQEATNRVIESTLSYAGTVADSAVATATANGVIMDSLTEAQIRADATVSTLRQSLNAPGLTDAAREQITSMIEDLEAAQESGDIEAILRLTGAAETTGELDEATQDRETRVNVESRGGPAVVSYLDRITRDRLLRIRLETRNGPAVDDYLDRLTAQRLAIIRVESRNGPAVDAYLDRLAEQARTAYIDVRERGAGAGAGGTFGGPTMRGAPGTFTAGHYGDGGTTVEHMTVVVQADSGGRLTQQSLAEAGRQTVAAIAAYERRNGRGWRAS
jgi:hypothetical protein